MNPQKGCTKGKKVIVYDNASELCSEYLEINFNQYMTLSGTKKRKLGKKYDSEKTVF